jgi:hypothetical protein
MEPMQPSRLAVALTSMSALLLGAACKEKDTTSPKVLHVPGSYRATTFTTTTTLGTENILQAGGSVTAQFDPSGDVRGHVTIPQQGVNTDFAGTWKLNRTTVQLAPTPSNILIDALSYKVSGDSLIADSTLGGTRVRLVLVKQ